MSQEKYKNTNEMSNDASIEKIDISSAQVYTKEFCDTARLKLIKLVGELAEINKLKIEKEKELMKIQAIVGQCHLQGR